MAYDALHQYLKHAKPLEKRSDAALKTYTNTDHRAWTADKKERSFLIRDIVTRPHSVKNEIVGDVDIRRVSNDECIQKMAELQKELDNLHILYKEASKRIETFEAASQDNQKTRISLHESQEKIKAQDSCIKQLEMEKSEEYDRIVRERDALIDQLSSMKGVEERMRDLMERADEADCMEQEIIKLKRELEKCKCNKSCDKTKNVSKSCDQCPMYEEELQEIKNINCGIEKKNSEIMAERNFLRQKSRSNDLLEAELILYKSKYEECECKILSLKEMICKSETSLRQSQNAQAALKDLECKIYCCENENQNLVTIIERLNMDLKERDIYIESLTKCLHEETPIEIELAPKKAISYESIASGTVESIVKKMSKETTKHACKSKLSNCKCSQISSSSSTTCSQVISRKCNRRCVKKPECKPSGEKLNLTTSQMDSVQFEKMLNEVLLLRQQNTELEKELRRVKNDLMQMTKVVDEVEQQRQSNEQLECQLDEIRSSYTIEIEQINSSCQNTVKEKIGELNQIESRLKCEIEKTNRLEEKISTACDDLSNFKEYRAQCEALNCTQKTREAEIFKNDCHQYLRENQELKCQIDCLQSEIEKLTSRGDQRNIIKKSVMDFKKHYDEKVQMIKCYEEKIKQLEKDNEIFRCKFMQLSDDSMGECDVLKKAAKYTISSLENEELLELHERIRRAMIDVKPSAVEIHTDYSKLFDRLCEKYNIPVRDDETCSTKTFPTFRSRSRKKGACVKKIRSRSNDLAISINCFERTLKKSP